MGGGQYPDATPGGTGAPRRGAWIVAVVLAVVVALVAGAWWMLVPRDTAAPLVIETVAPTSTPISTPTPTPTPTPTATDFAANTAVYDTAALTHVDVFAIHPALPVDTDPLGAVTEWRVRSVAERSPVFADPTGEPVAALPRDYMYGGTTVPVIERREHWVKVLLVGRQAMPSNGNPAQLVGWLRIQDVEFTTGDTAVHVSLSGRTVDVVRAGVAERIATDFGWGTDATPTPVGRSFVMTTRVEPSFDYTRGNPIVYLSVQSPTLDGFGGQPAAITAFHYHDERSGPVSNGCLRVAAEATHALAALPEGTPVVVWP